MSLHGRVTRQVLGCLTLCFLLLSAVACGLFPASPTQPPGEITTGETEPELPDIVINPLLISEIMSVNSSSLAAADGSFPDWIEIFNSGSEPLDLAGYQLSDRIDDPGKWTFPARLIQPGEYLVVFASGLADNDESADPGELHAGFRLSGAGEDLIFSDPAGNVLALVRIPPLAADLSYGLLDDAANALAPYWYLRTPTPGQPNGPDGYKTAAEARPPPEYNLLISEYISQNNAWPDRFGDLSDWLELYNPGPEILHLAGFTLSDNPDNIDKWTFPEVSIAPGQYLVIWLSGRIADYDPADPTTLHAPFALGAEDEYIVMHDPQQNLVLSQPLEYLPEGISRGRCPEDPDRWLYFPRPTPGSDNTTAGFESLDGALSLFARGIWINEVSAIDSERSRGRTLSRPDWLELYNGTDAPVLLAGYGLSDRREDPYRQILGDLTIGPGEYLVIKPESFGLSADGETIWLTDPDGWTVDWFETGKIPNGASSGRGTDSSEPAASRYFFLTPTPGGPNTTPALSGRCLQPQIKAYDPSSGQPHDNLYFTGSLEIRLESPQPQVQIRYTLDGSFPGENAPVYESPLLITAGTVINCRAESSGLLPSQAVGRTYLAGAPHDLPVLSIQLPREDFTDPSRGIYANFTADLEHQAFFQFYETDGALGIDFTAGLSLHGSFSRREAQKSMQVSLRALYGQSQITYPFFPDNPVITHERLVLRTSGQDWKITKLRDAFMMRVVKGYTAMDYMDYRPCVVYVNGEYFGLYEIREKVSKHYMAAHHGADPDNIDIIKGNRIVLSGDMQEYDDLIRFVSNNDLRDPQAYAQVMNRIDAASLMDFLIIQSFYTNRDSGNIKFWRERSDEGVWRWVLFDLDWGLFPDTYRQNNLKYDLLDPAGHGHAKIFHTTLQVRLMQNPEFRQAFIERYAWYLNEVFVTERMLTILDDMTEDIRSEMPRQIDRWGAPASLERWEANVASLRRIVGEKRQLMLIILRESFTLSQEEMRELFPEDEF